MNLKSKFDLQYPCTADFAELDLAALGQTTLTHAAQQLLVEGEQGLNSVNSIFIKHVFPNDLMYQC